MILFVIYFQYYYENDKLFEINSFLELNKRLN